MKFFFTFLLIVFIFFPKHAKAQEVSESGTLQEAVQPPESYLIELHDCLDEDLGIRFLCNPDWQVQTDEHVVMLIISQEPTVTLTIAKSEHPVVFLEQLNDAFLAEIGGYAPGFLRETLHLEGKDIIRIEGVARDFPEMKLLDYYFIKDFALYSILFSIDPEEQYPLYRNLIERILESFEVVSFQEPREDLLL